MYKRQVQHAHLDLVIGQLFKRLLDSLHAALHVRLDNDVEVGQLALVLSLIHI